MRSLTCSICVRTQYTIFFIAVEYWLANPRHYEVTRDIGELLSSSEYADGIDLTGENDHYEDEPTQSDDGDEYTQSDLDFIDDRSVSDGTTSEEEFEISQGIGRVAAGYAH